MSSTAEPSRLAGQIGRFVVIGSLSAGTDLGCYYLLTSIGLNAAVAKGISFVLGMALGWVGNKFWTFASPKHNLAEPVAYVLWYTLTLGLNVLINAGALWILSFFLAEDWTKAAAAILATGASAVANFVGLRWIVFARRAPA
jgi:putative flippase GtrA